MLAVEVALASGDLTRASALLPARTTALLRPELLLSAQVAVRAVDIAAVAQRLQLWVTQHPRDAQAWQLLSGAYATQGLTLRAIRASAESQVAMLDYPAALDRFKAAQDVLRPGSNQSGRTTGNAGAAADHIDASIIDTRLRQVELLLKEQSLDR